MKRALTILLMSAAPLVTSAGDVTITKTHLCCGAASCVEEALADVAGVDQIATDVNAKTIQFRADSADSAQAGVDALAEHGFYGVAQYGDKKLSLPPSGAKKGDKSNRIVLQGVHLCCGACVDIAKKSLEEVAGLSVIEIDRVAGTITLKGGGMDAVKVIEALNSAGFYATLKSEKPKDGK